MKLLNPRQRALVWYVVETGTDNWTDAVTKVGYTGSYETLRVTASRLRRDPKIGLAIREVTESQPNFDAPMALNSIRRIASDPSHKDCGKMSLALLGMAGMSPVARTEATHTHVVVGDPLVALEAKLSQLPPDVAAALRAQLFPPAERIMIDVTPVHPADPDDTGTAGPDHDPDLAGGISDEEAAALLKDIF